MGTFGIGTLLSKWNGVCTLFASTHFEVRVLIMTQIEMLQMDGCLEICFDFGAIVVISNTWSSNIWS
jgi:hypothetical protein